MLIYIKWRSARTWSLLKFPILTIDSMRLCERLEKAVLECICELKVATDISQAVREKNIFCPLIAFLIDF